MTLEDLERDECLRLLATAQVGRIGLVVGGMPAILPVNFALVESHILIRTVPGTKLDAAMMRTIVAFEVDDYAPDGSRGWSVLVRGHCSEVTEPAERAALTAGPPRPWVYARGVADRLVRIDLSFVSGRRFRR